jgi:small nuclear ribonucleoprotein (snRNP)-like protein
MIEKLVGQDVVVDLSSSYVCLGTLVSLDEQFIHLKDADIHDLRDSDTTRENYVASSFATGIKRNRKEVLLARRELVAIARFRDIVDE